MVYYFILEYKILLRKFIEAGVHPLLGAILILLILWISSFILFAKTIYAPILIAAVYLYFLIYRNNAKRLKFIQGIFSVKKYYSIRFYDNLIMALPFVGILAYHEKTSYVAAILGIAAMMTFIPVSLSTRWIYPTPFWKRPYEFIVGFRKTILPFILGTVILIQAVRYENYNLGVFVLAMTFVLAMGYYSHAEPINYVNMYSIKPQKFILGKLISLLKNMGILALPATIILMIVFPHYYKITLLVFSIGFILPILMLLAKYSVYPQDMHIPQVLLCALGIFIPFTLPLVMWIFYKKAIVNLTPILS